MNGSGDVTRWADRRLLALAGLFALLLPGALAARASQPVVIRGVVVHLRCRGERAVYLAGSPDREVGVPVAKRFFAQSYPGRLADGREAFLARKLWEVVEVLEDDDVRRDVAALLRLSDAPTLHLCLVLDDDETRVFPGENVAVKVRPRHGAARWLPVEVEAPTGLSRVALRFDVSVDDLRRQNPERYDVFPHTLERAFRGRDGVFVGEVGVRAACRCRGDVAALLVHEFAHIVDDAAADPQEGVGLSLAGHRPSQMTSPVTALREGWADYWTARHAPSLRERRGQVFDRLWTYVGPEGGPRRWLGPGELRLGHYLCHPVTLGNLLYDLERTAGGPGPLFMAMRTAWGRRNPTIADVLGAFVGDDAALRRALALVLRVRTRGVGTPQDAQDLLAGRLPSWLQPCAPPGA